MTRPGNQPEGSYSWGSERLEQVSRHSNPQTDSKDAGDTAESLGDTNRKEAA